MQTKTHLALGHYLLSVEKDAGLHRHSGFFLLGCMEPDYNLATYLRGLKGHGVFHGHNAENSFAYVSGCLDSFEENGPGSGPDYFRLGALLHYVADAFTGPHNSFWTGGMVGHAVYELKLHGVLTNGLNTPDVCVPADGANSSLSEFFAQAHKRYCEDKRGPAADSHYIVQVCSALLRGILSRGGRPERPGGAERKEMANGR